MIDSPPFSAFYSSLPHLSPFFSWLDANILLPILRLSSFRIGFFRFFFLLLLLFFPSPFFLLLVASSSMIILGRRGNVSYDWQLHFSTRASFVANNGGVSFSWKIVGRLEMTGIFHEGVARANNWLLVVSRSKGSPWRERLMRFFRFTWYGLVRMLEMNF